MAVKVELDALGVDRADISYAELVTLVTEHGAATDAASAAAVCQTLSDAGVIIRLGDVVYLHPQDITRAVLRALPGRDLSGRSLFPFQLHLPVYSHWYTI